MYVIPGLGKGQHQVVLINEVNTTSVLTIHFIPGDFNQFSRLFSLPVLCRFGFILYYSEIHYQCVKQELVKL